MGDMAAWRAVAEAATPGPWETCGHDSGLSYREMSYSVITVALGDHVASVDYNGDAEGPHAAEGADAKHIATFDPPTVLAILDRLEAAESKVARVEAVLDAWASVLRAPASRPGYSGGAVLDDLRAALEPTDG